MFITSFDQILVHLVSDYFLQNDWMALNKKKNTYEGYAAAIVHAITYTIPFLILTQSWKALLFIMITHFIIDKTNIISYLIWLKNNLYSTKYSSLWEQAKSNMGFHPSRPAFISVWIAIIVDNTFHIILNGIALKFL